MPTDRRAFGESGCPNCGTGLFGVVVSRCNSCNARVSTPRRNPAGSRSLPVPRQQAGGKWRGIYRAEGLSSGSVSGTPHRCHHLATDSEGSRCSYSCSNSGYYCSRHQPSVPGLDHARLGIAVGVVTLIASLVLAVALAETGHDCTPWQKTGPLSYGKDSKAYQQYTQRCKPYSRLYVDYASRYVALAGALATSGSLLWLLDVRIERRRAIQEAWDAVVATDRAEAYESFLREYPDTSMLQAAWSRMAQLDFRRALEAADEDSYSHFIRRYPDAVTERDALRIAIDTRMVTPPASSTTEQPPDRGGRVSNRDDG